MKQIATLLNILLLLLTTHTTFGREVLSLNDDWRIFSSLEHSSDEARNISLPYCWDQSPSAPISITPSNYLRRVYAPAEWRFKRIFLKFYGVQSVADLFVNGHHVGEHRGGSTAFGFEVSQYLRYDDDNTFILRVSSAPQNDVLPTSIEHEIYGGVYRDVELIITPKSAVNPIYYGTDGLFVTTRSVEDGVAKGDVQVEFLTPSEREHRIELYIRDNTGEVRFKRIIPKQEIEYNGSLKIPFEIKRANLWSPDSPNLYSVELTLRELGRESEEEVQESIDVVRLETGLRVITLPISGSKDGAVKINGKRQLMRGVSLYHDHPTDGGAITRESYRKDLEMITEMGANAIRSAVVPHGKYLYSLCDKEGVMVWIDSPLSRSPFLSDVAYYPTRRFEENGEDQLREIIYQNYNHPSVVMWGIFSLLSPRGDSSVEYIRRLNRIAKEIDPMRLTVAQSDQNGAMNEVCDLIVWRQNIGWNKGLFSDVGLWRDMLQRRWSAFRSAVIYGENGCVEHKMERGEVLLSRGKERKNWYPESRQSSMHEDYTQHLARDTTFWGLWLTSMYDYKSPRNDLGEKYNGVVTFDRRTRKDAYYLYKALWNTKEPSLHIADKRLRLLNDTTFTLRVYSSAASAPIAKIDGAEFAMDSIAPAQYQIDSIKVLDRVKVVVSQGELRDSAEFIYKSPLRAREH